MSKLIDSAKEYCKAKEVYGVAIRAHIRDVEPLEDMEKFWHIAMDLRVGSDPKRDVESEVHNLFCSYVYGSFNQPDMNLPKTINGRWELMAQFVRRYEAVVRMLSNKLCDMPGIGRGDDSFGDLVDSLPMAGPHVYDCIMDGTLAAGEQLEQALDGHSLERFILRGENYIAMHMGKALEKSFIQVANDEGDEE